MGMNDYEIFEENILSFTAMLGGNPGGVLSRLPSGSFAAMSGLPFAGENYAVFKGGASACEISDALEFFSWRRVPFIAPQFPGLGEKFSELLASLGLSLQKRYTAMTLDRRSGCRIDPAAEAVLGESAAGEWGDAVWRGFGGDAPTPQSYVDFAKYLAGRWENKLYALRVDGAAVSCGLLHKSEHAYGVYYFATVPQMRRRGLARRMMDTLAAAAFETRGKLVLLSTEEGLPFYLGFGFTPLSDIPIYSSSDDI